MIFLINIETPIPYYVKPVEVPTFKAKYVGEDGKYYNIVGAQFIYGDDLSTYGMFTCEEDAALNMRLTKIDKNTKLKLNLSDLPKLDNLLKMSTLSTTGLEKIDMDNIKAKAKELMSKLKR